MSIKKRLKKIEDDLGFLAFVLLANFILTVIVTLKVISMVVR